MVILRRLASARGQLGWLAAQNGGTASASAPATATAASTSPTPPAPAPSAPTTTAASWSRLFASRSGAHREGMDQAKRAEAALQQLEQGPLLTAKKLGSLAALSALYRDMHLAAQSIDARLRGSANPLYDEPPTSMAAKGKGGSGAAAPGETAAPAFPTLDTTTLPDTEVLSGMRLEQKHMDKISAWVALQPNHIETSHTLLTGINLFPPQEATYPTYVDFDAVVKGLEKHKSRSRLRQLRRLKLRQDKFQLATWNHHSGH